jgi:hypothetical protein
MDKIITWIIIGWAIASVFWLSQTKKWKEVTSNITTKLQPGMAKTGKKALSIFWKIIAFFVYLFSKK